MEALVVLLALMALAAVVVAPLLAVIAFARVSGLAQELSRLRADVRRLEERFGGRSAQETRGRPTGAAVPSQATDVASGASSPGAAAPATPPSQVERPAAGPSTETGASVPRPAPVPEPQQAAAVFRPAAAASPPAPRPPDRPVIPPSGPPSSGPAFDWEGLLGIRGAAWVGGLVLVMAAIFLAKMAIDRGLVTPALRVVLMVATGVALLLGAELRLRRGFATTANALSGAGIAILYAAFYAAHALYGLFPSALVPFALMILVTVVAGTLAVRYDAPAIAILGLLGGLATPVLLSTGEDRPLSLFSYLLLLNVGLFAVALRRRWHALMAVCLAGTLLIQLSWVGRFLAPSGSMRKLVIGFAVFLVFGLLYLLTSAFARSRDEVWVGTSGAVGGLAPFLFALYVAGSGTFAPAPQAWPLLFAFVAVVDVALVAVALGRDRVELFLGAAVASTVVIATWAANALSAENVLGATVGALAVSVVLSATPRVSLLLGRDPHGRSVIPLEVGGLVAGLGLGVFGFVLTGRDLGEPPWAFLLVLVGLTVLLLERSGARRVPGTYPVAATGVAFLAQIWIFAATETDSLARNLAVPLVLAIVLSVVAEVRRRRGRLGAGAAEDEGAAVGAGGVALIGLLFCLANSGWAGEPAALFAALAVGVAVVVASSLRSGWAGLLPALLGIVALFSWIWHATAFRDGDLALALGAYGIFYLSFLSLPFALARNASWRRAVSPWVASVLAGPALYPVMYAAVSDALGKAAIGLLPLTLAGASVVALTGISRRFVERPGDADSARLRLRYLALYAALALGFVAVAIPTQLDRQWITIGWAIEAALVWWLFGRLPHRGLVLFGALLFGAVGVRLLINPAVFRYEARGPVVFNWLLYGYGVPAVCCFLGAGALRRALARGRGAGGWLPAAATGLGILVLFWLINLEIADAFSTARFIEWSVARNAARDMTMSVAWGLYALALLVVGLWSRSRAMRFVSLGFAYLTVAKVFLYDLAQLRDAYRVFSFLGLGLALIAISLLYQRFVLQAGVGPLPAPEEGERP